MRNSYEIRARKFLDAILPYIDWCKTVRDYEFGVEMFNRETGRKVRCAHGATRIALITSDYVIKFDYNNCAVDDYGGCEAEINCYYEAVCADVDAAFCPIKHLYGNYYVMPRANCYYSNYDLKKFWNELSLYEEDFIYNHVQDVHAGNVGRYNGRLVLIDYACSGFDY